MKFKFQIILTLLLTLIALAIAIPTFNVNFQNKSYIVSNIEPADFATTLIQDEFLYKPSIDLVGGYTVVFDVDLTNIEGDKLQEFKNIESIIARRMALIGLKDFEFTSFYNLEEEKFQLHLTTPDEIETSLIQVLASPGLLDVLVDDPEALENENAETVSITEGRRSAGISNEDIQSIKIVSDSRIYSSDPETPNNFGLEVVFKPESKQKLQLALLSNISTGTPLIFTLDGSFVALQASGFIIDPYQENDRILLYTTLVDSKLNNAVLGAVMSSPALDPNVSTNPAVKMNPVLGDNAIVNAKLITVVFVAFLAFLIIVILRRQSIYVLAATFLFGLFSIALHKILNLNLSLSLILGVQLTTLLFVLEQIFLVNKANKFIKSEKDAEDFLEDFSIMGWKPILQVLLLVPVIIFFENLLTASVNQLIQVLILGVLVWQIYRIVFLTTLFKIFVKPYKSAK